MMPSTQHHQEQANITSYTNRQSFINLVHHASNKSSLILTSSVVLISGGFFVLENKVKSLIRNIGERQTDE